MTIPPLTKEQIELDGFAIVAEMYTSEETDAILAVIDGADSTSPAFRKTTGLFAIRRFLKEVPGVKELVLNDRLKHVIRQLFGENYFVVKSIYFDKPEQSNWFVAYHQDLTIAVDKRIETPGYGPWTVKQDQFAVQPPLAILQNNLTIRIHLDDTDEHNGALKVINGSHNKGVYRAEHIDHDYETESICRVPKGGIMIMRPLLMHASNRSTNNNKRRVIHIEFSKAELPEELQWAEKE